MVMFLMEITILLWQPHQNSAAKFSNTYKVGWLEFNVPFQHKYG